MRRPTGLLAFTTLGLVLASCGQQAPQPASAPTSGNMVTLTLASPLAGFKTQGLPTGPDGRSTVTHLKIKVKNAQGTYVQFNGQNVYQQNGAQTFLTLSSTQPNATVVLPRGTYTFENIGKDNVEGTFLAYGTNDGVDLTQGSSTINLQLHALADEGTTTFIDKFKWKSVATQETLDLRLNVLNAQGTVVPTGDYSPVTYQIVDAQGQSLSGVADVLAGSSKLGARVKVIGTTSTSALFVKASTQAWQATGSETAAPTTFSKTFSIAFDKTGLSVDTQAPQVTLNAVGTVTAGQDVTLAGTASDDGDLMAIRVFDGSMLIGSTDAAEWGQNGVAEVMFTPGSGQWSLNWTPTTSGAADLLVIAADKAGNEGRAQAQKALQFLKSFGATSFLHSVAIKQDGTVAAWGNNGNGQTDVPAGLTNVVATSTGWDHSLALKQDSTIVAWGYNGSGQTTIPVGLTDVVAIAAGSNHSLVLKQDGTVAAWGNNGNGQTDVPAGLTDVVAIAAGQIHSLVLKQDGTVVAWGYDGDGQTTIPAGLTDVVAISAGYRHSLALKADGTVVAWGLNNIGQATIPAGLTDVVAISAGVFHSLALKADGTVVAWGSNNEGNLNVPAGLTDVVAISAGFFHSLALKADGTMVAWGDNAHGNLNVPTGPYLIP
ncbi:hypothetical protein GCM10010840_34650 [Deinococcus aerolatus]|uniref:Alpha-tubulin suppressor n=1 Tax=Deinococcus aerolatus TaxID=522487 RepID=A0ABQ2GFD6_9DEIO|nr:hypothetical protein [Deinococcus aerolatus]GGL93729.1 hypothetical protein GCM10010840_34650 [Deinococcus aerolatus]